jgi:hypothetical protein
MNGNEFIPLVPEAVKEVVSNASLWLVKNAKKIKPYNVVFSGSVKLDEVRDRAWFNFKIKGNTLHLIQ